MYLIYVNLEPAKTNTENKNATEESDSYDRFRTRKNHRSDGTVYMPTILSITDIVVGLTFYLIKVLNIFLVKTFIVKYI